jgi:hypothetical protein
LNVLKDKVIRIVLLSGKPQKTAKAKQEPIAEMLNEVDAAMKRSKLFKMTQVADKKSVWEGKRSQDREVIETTLEQMMRKLQKSHSTSSFCSRDSHDRDFKPEKSTLNQSPSRERLYLQRQGEQLLHFQKYLSDEVKDVTDFKRFLGQLREVLQRKAAKEKRKRDVQVDKLSQERNKQAFISDNFFVPKDNRATLSKQSR